MKAWIVNEGGHREEGIESVRLKLAFFNYSRRCYAFGMETIWANGFLSKLC